MSMRLNSACAPKRSVRKKFLKAGVGAAMRIAWHVARVANPSECRAPDARRRRQFRDLAGIHLQADWPPLSRGENRSRR